MILTVKLTGVSNAAALQIRRILRQLPVWERSSHTPFKAWRVSPGGTAACPASGAFTSPTWPCVALLLTGPAPPLSLTSGHAPFPLPPP